METAGETFARAIAAKDAAALRAVLSDPLDFQALTPGRHFRARHVAYRLRVRAWDGDYLIEQQAYYDTAADGRIGWMRLLCSGYRPVLAP